MAVPIDIRGGFVYTVAINNGVNEMASIHSQEVLSLAKREGITDLQAYYKIKARDQILALQARERQSKIVAAIHSLFPR